jgi:Family of unknown function (DUF6502)
VQAPSTALLAAIDRLLRPLVRLLIGRGVMFPDLADRLRRLYVEVAEEHFRLDAKEQTVSRVSLLTGVHRKEVKRLREEPQNEAALPPQMSLGAQLISQWLGNAMTTEAEGAPLPLPRLEMADGSPSFASLVQGISRDVRPRAVLDELVRQGICRIDADDKVHLDQGAFVPRTGFDDMVHYFGRILSDHIAAGAHNLSDGATPFFDRAVIFDRLSEADALVVQQLASKHAMQALLKVNRQAVALADASVNDPKASWRITFGSYFYMIDQERDPDQPRPRQRLGQDGAADAPADDETH